MPSFTPKQIALAMGVSESSVKRWCDLGRLSAAKTVGGHRKVEADEVMRFVRQTGKKLVAPQALGMVACATKNTAAESVDTLLEALLAGDEAACRELLLGLYQHGASIAELGDALIGPVFHRIGEGWAAGEISVREERRACEVLMPVLHELRRWLPPPAEDAPLAICATPSNDFAEVPIRLVELTLLAAGWRAEIVGAGLPLEEIADAITSHEPSLVCLSVTHVEDVDAYVSHHNSVLGDIKPSLVVGGNGLCCGGKQRLACEHYAMSLGGLVEWLKTEGSPVGKVAANEA